MDLVRFGVYEADLRAAELRKHGVRIRLQERPFKVLTALLRESGKMVTREELRRELWPADTFVDFDHGINSAVRRLREALSDSADNPRFIETVGRRGYRFIAPVTGVAPLAKEPQAISTATGPESTETAVAMRPAEQVREPAPFPGLPIARHHHRRQELFYSVAAVVCMVSAIAVLKFWPLKTRPAAEQRAIRSLAVLPLENLSGDSRQDYLSDGLTEAVTTLLAQIGDLRVISRTTAMRYKHPEKTTPEIARELGVDALVEGSVVRSGNHLRLTVQLIQTSNDRHIWANSYDRELEDVVSLEGELSREIAGQIRIRLTPEQLETFTQKRTVDPEAYALYLQGRYYWYQRNEESLTRAIGYFEQAIARDEKFAPAYAGLADTYLVMPFFKFSTDERASYERAEVAAAKALALDPRSADSLKSDACVKLYKDWDYKGAEREFQQALVLNPNHATAHQWYAELLSKEGRYQEALVEINRALQLDPLSAIMHHQAAGVLHGARQYPQALSEYRRSLELDPNLYVNYFGMYLVYRRMGDYEHAIPIGAVYARHLGTRFEKAYDEAAHVFATQGKQAFLRRSLGLWAKSPSYGASIGQALDYCELREYDECLEVLEREYKRHNLLVDVALAPEMDGLHDDPRYQEFLHKIGVR